MARLVKVSEHQQAGEYKPTVIDEMKATVDFRIVQVAPYYIRWADGRGEVVTERKLNALKKQHTWTTDF